MTEEEAKKKACCAGAKRPQENGPCVGSGCMAWRNVLGIWHQERGKFLEVGEIYSSGDVVIDKPNGHGYCGLAGQP